LALVLAVACTAFGAIVKRDVVPGTNFDPIAFSRSCVGQCFQQPRHHQLVQQIKPQVHQWYERASQSGSTSIPDIPQEKFDQLCSEIDELKTCVNNCNHPDDATRKTKTVEILDAFKDLVCDPDIKANINCLKQFASIPSEQCNTQCASHKDAVTQHATEIAQGGRGQAPDFEKMKAASTAACKLVNCRLTCRKPEIIEKCQQTGYDAAKKAVRETAVLFQTIHRQFRPAENYPDECKPDNILQGA
jgi:hypothetical protein